MKHENYELLNLIGYGISKFDMEFIKEFGFNKKNDFYNFCVDNNIANTNSTVKNRMDLFDPFFPNKRKGWWQKGDTYLHRKVFIDNLFGNEDVSNYAQIVKLYMSDDIKKLDLKKIKPLTISKFKKLQETGLEAELYFLNNFKKIELFKFAELEDARLYGDGYDFQMNVKNHMYLTEIKGIRENKGRFRMTSKEYKKALEYKDDYIISLILNLNHEPRILTIENPVRQLNFKENTFVPSPIKEYILKDEIS